MRSNAPLLGLVVVLACTLVGCDPWIRQDEQLEKSQPRYRPGDMIQSILDQRPGIVIAVNSYDASKYDVRFAAWSHSHATFPESPRMIPYAVMTVYEFEIEPRKNNNNE